MPHMRIRSKVAVTTQVPIRIMEMVDYIRDDHRIKITNLFESALEEYIFNNYPDAVKAVDDGVTAEDVQADIEEAEATEEE